MLTSDLIRQKVSNSNVKWTRLFVHSPFRDLIDEKMGTDYILLVVGWGWVVTFLSVALCRRSYGKFTRVGPSDSI